MCNQDKCKLYKDLEEQAENIEMGIEAWLRKICLPGVPSPESSIFLAQWSTLFDEQGDTLKKEVAKKKVIKTKEEGKPAEVKAVSTHVEVPYVPRKIDRLPADLNKLKK